MANAGCPIPAGTPFPDYQSRLKLERQGVKSAQEHILIFADAARTRQVWLWVKRDASSPSRSRQETFNAGDTGERLVQRLQHLAVEFEEEKIPSLFFTVKALTACRLEDICSLRSDQLRDGRIVFPASATKNRSERSAVLPEGVFKELVRYAGPMWLWEQYPAELRAPIRRKGNPCHRLNPEFAPRRLYLWVVALMQEYQKQTGKNLSSHDYRKAACTRAAEQDVHPKRAAVAFDVTPETMMKYYTATEKKQTADEVLGGLAGRLLPKKKPRAE